MSNTVKKAILSIIIALIIVIGILVSIFIINPKWKPFKEHKSFFDGQITEIELQKQFLTMVSFTDTELIDRWEKYFETMEIKRDYFSAIKTRNMEGGGTYIKVKAENSNYSFKISISPKDNNCRIKIGNGYYFFKSNEDFDNIFNKTYDIAAERHGEVNLWE